jgi:flagellar hook-length control protein FliK
MSSTAIPGASALPLDADLVQRIRDALDKGVPLNDVVGKLAGSLATSVANLLGISVDAAKQRLTQAFTQALSSPNGTGPPLTNAERASSLVARFRQLAEIATRVTNGDTGQPIRTIAGTSLDAVSAKANPAPQTDRILRDALAALAAPASPVTAATTVPTAAPAAPAAESTGRSVALLPGEAISTDGNTLLGRILARAMLLGSQRTAPSVASSTNVPDTSSAATRTINAPVAPNTNPPAESLVNVTTSNPAAQSHTNAVEAFVQALTSALARDAAPSRSPQSAGDPAADGGALLAATPQHVVPIEAPPMPFAVPTAPDVSAVAPPAPDATLPHAPPATDANAIVDQVLRGVSLRTSDGSSEVRLRLVPENLGDVSVKLVVTGGSVDASITAHSVDAQNALAGGQAQLARTLADAGLKLQSFSVGLAGGGFADTRDQANQQSWTRSTVRRIGGVESTDVDGNDDSSLLAAPVFGPPVYSANPIFWGHNYLV